MIKNQQSCNLSAGFTLIETLIYTLIISGVLTSAIFFSLNVLEGQSKARVFQEVQQNARFGLEKISQEIRAANDLNAGASTFSSNPGFLSLSHEDAGKNPTLFGIQDEKLVIKQGSNASTTLTSDDVRVIKLIFDNLSVSERTKNIKITITIEHKNPDLVTPFNASTTLITSVVIRDQSDQP
jgi:type II secretory pathway pseudopilin PulG